ncbi:ParM/StbA family protein [Aestuariicella hydrocarbonica]|uniref:ParM/StbA family protein n=1 Tax=Pseudomaricurvus hydrocarbonicus TaxID=1470433 RepID=A0A9E5MMQ2_9GAMM|nr:ParM/StbA family protein [Aestuariicella hydrocarbonica]NHO67079.1 ParM/StbA family protein [Aestuariicella hydrocarbonica]
MMTPTEERTLNTTQTPQRDDPAQVVPVGVDDGYAYTKVALPDGRLVAVPSRARIGAAGVTWIRPEEQRIFEYETRGSVYSVGAVDGEPTQFDEYPGSSLNRVIVQHALQQAGLSGRVVHMVTGLPVSAYYRHDGQQRRPAISVKREGLKVTVEPIGSNRSASARVRKASVAFHEVIPEALAAWYDHVIVTQDDGVTLDADRLNAPIAIVDIGGRTTDYVVVQDQGVVHEASGSLNRGMLNVTIRVANRIQEAFDLNEIGEQSISRAVDTHTLRVHGKDHDVSAMVTEAKRELVERLYTETRRKLGLGAELDRVLFVGGGSMALVEDIANWFPNQIVADHAAFANARGMLKYLQYVCDDPENNA